MHGIAKMLLTGEATDGWAIRCYPVRTSERRFVTVYPSPVKGFCEKFPGFPQSAFFSPNSVYQKSGKMSTAFFDIQP